MGDDPSAHVVIRNGGVVVCRHCGAEYDMQLPQLLDLVMGITKCFTKAHRACPPRTVPSDDARR